MSHCYLVYGLEVECSSPIEALQCAPSDSRKIAMHYEDGPEPPWAHALLSRPRKIIRRRPDPAEGAELSFVLTQLGEEEGFELAYSDGARFVADGAALRLWGTFEPPLAAEDLIVYLLGPVMGFLLRRRRITCLHSSAVEFQGRAICLCGEAGFGKSTTAAAFALRGLPVTAEDIVPLEEEHGEFLAVPGYPRVCLWPESVKMLMGSEDALPLITPGWEKRYLALDGRRAKFAGEKLPLALVYVFAPRAGGANAPRIEALSAREAMLELVRNTYMNWVIGSEQRAAEFDTLCRLVDRVEVRRVVPHERAEKIGELCDLILRDAEVFLSATKNSTEPVRR